MIRTRSTLLGPSGRASGRASLDEDLLGRALVRQAQRPGLGAARTFAQLPVQLPPAAELHQATEASRMVFQLRAFTEWVSPQGRTLTAAGHLRPADARELVRLLGTGEEDLKFRSAAELPGLNLIVTWAKNARLVRKQGSRLVQMAKARPVLADAEIRWQRAFDTLFDPGVASAVCPPNWTDEPPTPVALPLVAQSGRPAHEQGCERVHPVVRCREVHQPESAIGEQKRAWRTVHSVWPGLDRLRGGASHRG